MKEQVQNIFGKNFQCEVGGWIDTQDIGNIKYENNSQNLQNDCQISQIYEKNAKNGSKNDNFYVFCEKDDDFVDKDNKYNQSIIYIVKPLDTFASVAKKLNISVKEVKFFAKTKHLFVGQKIHIQKS